MAVELDQAGDGSRWYPIETVSKSEGGYERVYQASSLHLRWPVALAAGASLRLGATFRVTQSRDRAAEDGWLEIAPRKASIAGNSR